MRSLTARDLAPHLLRALVRHWNPAPAKRAHRDHDADPSYDRADFHRLCERAVVRAPYRRLLLLRQGAHGVGQVLQLRWRDKVEQAKFPLVYTEERCRHRDAYTTAEHPGLGYHPLCGCYAMETVSFRLSVSHFRLSWQLMAYRAPSQALPTS